MSRGRKVNLEALVAGLAARGFKLVGEYAPETQVECVNGHRFTAKPAILARTGKCPECKKAMKEAKAAVKVQVKEEKKAARAAAKVRKGLDLVAAREEKKARKERVKAAKEEGKRLVAEARQAARALVQAAKAAPVPAPVPAPEQETLPPLPEAIEVVAATPVPEKKTKQGAKQGAKKKLKV